MANPIKHGLVALTAIAAVALTGGCGAIGDAAADSASGIAGTAPDSAATTPAATPEATSEAAPKATPKATETSAGESGFPDPCTLLSKAEVTSLTAREVTQIDEDGGAEGARFCQWQQSGGQLALFLTSTTPADFEVTVDGAETVDGVGEGAFWHSGHLYVLHGTVQIDVYSRGADPESRNLTDAKRVAATVIDRL